MERKRTARMMSLVHRLLRLRWHFHLLRRQHRRLREQQARLFRRRLGQLQQDLADQAEREGFVRTLEGYTAEMERRTVELALEHSDGDLAEASALLGVAPEELERLIERHGLAVGGER